MLGPLHTQKAASTFSEAIKSLRSSGAEILAGGGLFDASEFDGHLAQGFYARPTIAQPVSSDPSQGLWRHETFAPILNVAVFDELEEAIALNNAVPQGLSSSLWTRDIRNVGVWIGPAGSDCGIVNVRQLAIDHDFNTIKRRMTVVGECGYQWGGDWRCVWWK